MNRQLLRLILLGTLMLALTLVGGKAEARWYSPETAGFISRAPYPPAVEHAYSFGMQDPVRHVDPTGEIFFGIVILGLETHTVACAAGVVDGIKSQYDQRNDIDDKVKHCTLSCEITKQCGSFGAFAAGWGKEAWDVIGPGDASSADAKANAKGREIGGNPGFTGGSGRCGPDCETECKKAKAGGEI
jgi:hypothetical protein